MDLEKLRHFRKLVLISLFSDDDLMELFVIKGGSAIDLVYKIDSRASVDIDVSMENDLNEFELKEMQRKLHFAIEQTFEENGYTIFDFKLVEKPKNLCAEYASFWGGYQVEFKIQPLSKKPLIKKDIDTARVTAEVVGYQEAKRFTIDISKFEYCKDKTKADIDGFTVYVYSPKMLVFEKLRAICQQMAEYPINGGRVKKPRPNDFYDIHMLINHFQIDFSGDDYDVIESIFKIKKVDLMLLQLIPKYKDFFILGLETLKSTLAADKLTTFNFDTYFNTVLRLAEDIIKIHKPELNAGYK